MVPAREAGHVADLADHRGRNDGPAPKTSVRVVPDARTAAVSFFFASRIWASTRRRSARNSAASSQRAASTAPDGVIAPGVSGVNCGDPLGHAAGDQLAQHRVQPAGHLGPGPAQVPVALGPHLQHRRVIIGADLAAGR